jgi:adenylosuccinate lyase
VERIILPDSCTLLDYMLDRLAKLVDGLVVYPDRMEQNLAMSKGLYFSQSILLELTRRGMERKAAYEAVQKAAMATWQSNSDFLQEVRKTTEITKVIPEADLAKLCSVEQHFRHIDETFRRLGLTEEMRNTQRGSRNEQSD